MVVTSVNSYMLHVEHIAMDTLIANSYRHYVPSRSGARQVEAKGIFEGAEVNRSAMDWEYGAGDGTFQYTIF